VDGEELRWRGYRCVEDHFVDVTRFYHTTHYIRTWAHTELLAKAHSTSGWS
jgi:hypothetical protein